MLFKPNKTQFLTDRAAALDKAAFVILPVPYERTVSYGKGTKNGPAAILEASAQLEYWDEETKKETVREGLLTLAPVNCSGGEEAFFARLEKQTGELLAAIKGVPIFIGGEHSITQALIPPFQKRHKDLSILHFDAHADLYPVYRGSRRSHAAALYPASRKTRVVQIGIRNAGLTETKFMNTGNVKTYLMHENPDFGKLQKNILKDLSDTVYLSIDVDGFDPSVMPGTGTPQPGGFQWYDAMKLFRAVCEKKKVVGMDIVEVSPVKGSNITEFHAAKLAYRLMGYLASKH
ncbi:MAG: agmatinase [Elusimicrobia bacterium RIFOXYB2_FULL_62_6]|nr:MAG: agmatinase [Elusimicrobia bacterium RIFOXYB2_FULL_62_6]